MNTAPPQTPEIYGIGIDHPYLRETLHIERLHGLSNTDIQSLQTRLGVVDSALTTLGNTQDDQGTRYRSGDHSFSDFVCTHSGIDGLGYENGEYEFPDVSGARQGLSPVDQIVLRYTRIALAEKIASLDENKTDPITQAVEAYRFFSGELTQLQRDYPEAYSMEDYWQYIDYHLPDALLEKMSDPSRCFRIVRDDQGKIVAYFESKKNSIYSDTQTVQWIFIDPRLRGQGVARRLWDDFVVWCQENNYTSVWSFVALGNTISDGVHVALMTYGQIKPQVSFSDPKTLMYVNSVPKQLVKV